MTMLTRWDPFRELAAVQDRMNRLFQDSFTPFTASREEGLATAGFTPPVDIYEDEHNITLKMEVPGIEEKDIDIRLENNVLTVRGERQLDKEEKQENFHRIERHYGSFSRSFSLPNTVDTDNVQADYSNGVLQVRLAKRAEAKPKQIKVTLGQKTLEGKGKAA